MSSNTQGIDFELIHSKDDGENLDKKAVLLFHGLTGSPFEMKKYGMFLHKLGYDVFCYSFPGHGDRIDEIRDTTYLDWCNLAQEKYNKLRKQYDKFFLSGLCLGAAVALYLAQRNDDIDGIISLSTTLFLDGFSMPKIKFMMPLALNTIFRYLYTFPEDDCLGIKNELTRQSLAKIMSKTTVGMDNYPLCCVYELLKLSKAVRKDLDKINAPILLIHSVLDNLTSPKSAHIVYDNVSSKVKKYIELNDSYHMVLYDNEKKFVMENVEKFIREILDSTKEKELVKL